MTTAKQEPSEKGSEHLVSNFDPEKLRARYSQERQKRLRPDANGEMKDLQCR